jgi:hypothetical protein
VLHRPRPPVGISIDTQSELMYVATFEVWSRISNCRSAMLSKGSPSAALLRPACPAHCRLLLCKAGWLSPTVSTAQPHAHHGSRPASAV